MAKRVNKTENSDLGTLKRTPRNVFTPSKTTGSDTNKLVDEVRNSTNKVVKQISNQETTLLNVISGSFSTVIDLISDNIIETLNNVESSTFGIYNFLADATDKNHILGASMPKDYFETVKSSVYQVGKAFDIVNNKSYAGQHIAHLINIESGVYALAAAFWGWDKAKKGKEIDSNIKTLNKDLTEPVVNASKAVFDVLENSKNTKHESSVVTQGNSTDGNNQQAFFNSVIDWRNEQTRLLNNIISSIKGINITNNVQFGGQRGNRTQLQTSEAASNLINEAMLVIDNLMRFAEEDSEKLISGSKRQKRLQKAFNSYKSSIKYIITSINDIYEEVSDKIKSSDINTKNIDKIVKAFSDSMSLITKMSDDNTDDLLNAFKNINIILGRPSDMKKNTGWSMTMYGITKKLIDFIDWIGYAVSNKEEYIKSTKAGLNSITDVFSMFTYISNTLNLKTLLSLYIKLESISKFIMPSINALNDIIENSEGFYFQYFAEETQPQLIKLIDALNIVGGHISIKDATKLSVGINNYGSLAKRLIEMAVNIEEELKEVDEGEIDRIVGRNGKLIKIGKLGHSINDINSAFKKAALTSVTAKIGTKLTKSVISDIFDIIVILSSNEFNGQLNKVTNIKDGVIINIKKLSDILYDTLKVGGKLSKYALHAKLGYKLSLSVIQTFNELLIEINNPKYNNARDTKTALGNIECMELVSEELVKLNKNGSKLTGTALTALVGFMLTKSTVTQLNKLVTILSTVKEDTLIQTLDNVQGMNDILTEMLKIVKIGTNLAVMSFPALLGFKLFHLAVKSGIKPLLASIYKLFEKIDAKEYMFELHSLASISTSLLKICLLGSMLTLFAPLAIAGFTLLVPAVIVLANALAIIRFVVGDKDSGTMRTVRDLGMLILKLGAVMMIGCLLGGIVQKMLPNIIIFTLTLSFFIFSIVSAISISTVFGGGLRHLEKSVNEIKRIVIMSAMVMLIGGMIVMLQPKLILYSFVFTFLLATFLFAIVGIVSAAARIMKGCVKELTFIMAFEIVTTTCLLVPAYIMMQNPGLTGYIFAYLGVVTTLIGGLTLIAWLIGKKNKTFIQAVPVMYSIAALSLALGITILAMAEATKIAEAAGGIDKLAETAATGLTLVGVIAGGAFVLGKFGDKAKMALGLTVIFCVELLVLGMAFVMSALANVTTKINEVGGFGPLWATIGSGFGLLTAMTLAVVGLGALAGTGVGGLALALGGVVIAELELLSYGMAKTLIAMSETSKVSINSKNLLNLLSSMSEFVDAMFGTFGNPIMLIKIPSTCTAVAALGLAISLIAKGVSEAANMHYTKYENGKKVGEFNLNNEDFQRAANNTKSVVSVLGQAIIDIYKENPEIFNTGTLVGDILGTETKFEKVCGSVSKLSKVISKIAKGVADMANLHFTKYENGKKVGEFNLGGTEFKAAAENTKIIVKILGNAIIDAYNSNPEIFTTQGSGGNFITNTLGSVAGFFGADTKFGKVAKSMMVLGNLISSLSRGISDISNLTVTEYDNNGKEKKRNMNETDFVLAAVNTDMIVTWLANTIIKVYESHPDLFTSGSSVGDALGFNPKFKNIIDTVSGLGSLMSNIAGGIQAMANNSIPVYGKNGEIIRKEPIKPQWYTEAATTVANVITCMGSAIMSVYEEHKDWFKAQGWSLAETSSNNAFTDVMKSCITMADMMSKYVEVIQQYATGKVDIYGPDGKVIGSMSINDTVYTKAATNVSSCISTLAESVYNTYNKYKDNIFKEDTFKPLMDNLESLSELLGKYSSKVKDYANLTYDVYDTNGKVIGKKNIGETEFTAAGKAVSSIITTLVKGVHDAYTSKDENGESFGELFKDTNIDPNKKNSGETWFGRIINSFLSVSPLVSSMAAAVKMYATLQVPEYNKAGVATGRMVKMTSQHFIDAGTSVSNIITSLVSAIGKVWGDQSNQKLFTNASNWYGGSKDGSNPFVVISKALNAAAKMVNDAAVATKNVLSIPGFENSQDIKTKLDTRIPIMTTALIQSVIEAYNKGSEGNNKNMFDNAMSDNSPFKKVAVAMQSAYDVVDKSSKVYDNVSKMDMSKLEQVTGTEGDVSSNKIYRMIKGLAQPIIDIYTSTEATGPDGQKLSYSKLFYKPFGNDSYFTRIQQGIDAVAKMMSNVKNAYDTISSIDYNVNDIANKIETAILGLINPIGTVYINNQSAFDDAAPISGVIGKVLSAANPITFLGKLFLDQQKQADTPAMRVIQALSAVAGTIGTVTKAYESIQNIQFDKEKSKEKMTNMITGLVEVFKDNSIDFSGAEDKAEAMKDFVEIMSQVLFGDKEDDEFVGVLTVYEKLQTMKIGSQFMANNMGKILSRMIEGVVNAVSVPVNIDLTLVDSSFDTMKRAIEILISIYKMPAEMLKPVMTVSNATDIDTLITNLSSTIISIPKKLGELMNETGPLSNSVKMNQLMGSAWNLKRAVANLAGAVSLIPINRDIDYFITYIQKLNKELESVPNLQNFVTETDNLIRFNSSINSLQVKNVEVLTKLFIEFNKFSSKFGNLDKFTQVLATKMAQCLTYLADQIRDSAKTINKSEEIQKKRQEQIQKTINEFKKLADQGLEVTVKAAETEAGSGIASYSTSEFGSNEVTTTQTLGSGSTTSRNNTLDNIANNVNIIARHYREK